ncbi:MAG: O-antigen ligase family protein, partial [Anaerolineales bacterium]|nr:O-antigen ligase family protein [Anaerolineales bacterium]
WFLVFSDILLLDSWNILVPAATLLLLILFTLTGLVWLALLRQHGFKLLGSSFDQGLLLLLLVLVIASLRSIDPSRSWRMSWQWIASILLFYISLTVFRAGFSRSAFSKALLLTLAVVLIGAYYQLYNWLAPWYAAGPWPDLLPLAMPRIWGTTVGPNVLAVMLNVGTMVALGLWYGHRGHRPVPLWGWFVLVAPMLIFPASRSGWLGLAAGFVVFHACRLLTDPVRRGNRQTYVRLGLLMGAVGLILVTLVIALRGETLSLSRLDSALYRTNFWQVALAMWRASPIWGQGLNTYASFYMQAHPTPPATLYVTAHSIYFQVLAELGLAGLLAVLWLTVAGLRLVARLWQGEVAAPLLGLLAALVTYQVHSLFDTPKTWLMALAALIMGALVAQLEPIREPKRGWLAWPTVWPAVWLIIIATGVWGYLIGQQYFLANTALAQGSWQEARQHLAQAEALAPYDETSVIALQALVDGALASQNPDLLPAAIQKYERLIQLEPGWSAHRANLAALYWQAGDTAAAISMMESAAAMSPDVVIYSLNLIVWRESLGQAAEPLIAQLANDDTVWHQAPFLTERMATPAAANNTSLVYLGPTAAEAAGLTEQAWTALYDQYRLQSERDPYDSRAYLTAGIAALFLNQPDEAGRLWRRADIIDGITSSVGQGGQIGTELNLWRLLQREASAAEIQRFQLRLGEQSPYGTGRGGQGSYTNIVLLRLPPPADLLPQLRCFTVRGRWVEPLLLARVWYENQGQAAGVTWIDQSLLGDGDGTISC